MKNILYSIFIVVMLCLAACQSSVEEEVIKVPTPEPVAKTMEKDTLPPFNKDNYEWKDGYIQLDWKFLSRVIYKEGYIKNGKPLYVENLDSLELLQYAQDTSILLPIFHDDIKILEGKPIQIGGYLIPLNDKSGGKMHFLSAYPMSQCFFCGAAGPETLLDVITKKSYTTFKMDDKITFRGKLHLNDTNLDYMNYMLLDAELVK